MKIKPGKVYEIAFSCDTPGPDIEEGLFRGIWTGERDTWGKLTFHDIDAPDEPLYLFEREITILGEAFPLATVKVKGEQ